MKFNFSNENATTYKFVSDIEHLERVRKITDIVFGSIIAVGLFIVVVICPIMVLH